MDGQLQTQECQASPEKKEEVAPPHNPDNVFDIQGIEGKNEDDHLGKKLFFRLTFEEQKEKEEGQDENDQIGDAEC